MKVSSMLYELYLSQYNNKLKSSKPYMQALTDIVDLEDGVRKELLSISDKALKLFDEFQIARTIYVCSLEETAYSTGFATGFKLALETTEE